MQRRDDGSVVLTLDEAVAVSKVLDLGSELVTQLDASEQMEETVEHSLLNMLNLLEELGVSSDELMGKLDQQPRSS